MTDSNEALADLAELARAALLAFAEAIRPPLEGTPDDSDLASLGLGRRQQQIAEVQGLDSEDGMTLREVACEIDYDAANTHRALTGLAERGITEGFRHRDRTRWRLTPRYRSRNPYLALARLIAPGEWTTFDDISLVVHGDLLHGKAVVRASVSLPDFPAHRVLPPGGQVPAAWRSHARRFADPGECVRLLASEGVAVDGDGRASRAHYISWDVLCERRAVSAR